ASLKEPRGDLHGYEYDGQGRLKTDTNPDGRVFTAARQDAADGWGVSLTTRIGRETTYGTRFGADDSITRTVTLPTGLQPTSVQKTDGTLTKASPDGTVWTFGKLPSTRMGTTLSSFTVKTPSGLTMTGVETFAAAGDTIQPTSWSD